MILKTTEGKSYKQEGFSQLTDLSVEVLVQIGLDLETAEQSIHHANTSPQLFQSNKLNPNKPEVNHSIDRGRKFLKTDFTDNQSFI